MDEYIAGSSNVVTYHNLLRLRSIPGIAVTTMIFNENTTICFDYAFISISRL